jgi:UDPglucose 6-dehydrogenase
LIKDFQSEKALVNIYDPGPQVSHDQIWFDLAEACSLVPLDTSTFKFYFVCLLSLTDRGFLRSRNRLRYVSAMEACENAEAVVIATEWKESKEIEI